MNLTYWIYIGIFIILGTACVWLYKKGRQKRALKAQIELQVLADFNTAEEVMNGNNGKLTPEEILWNIAKTKNPDNQIVEEVQEPEQTPIINKVQDNFRPKPKLNNFLNKFKRK